MCVRCRPQCCYAVFFCGSIHWRLDVAVLAAVSCQPLEPFVDVNCRRVPHEAVGERDRDVVATANYFRWVGRGEDTNALWQLYIANDTFKHYTQQCMLDRKCGAR